LKTAQNKPFAPAWEKLKASELAAPAEREADGTDWLVGTLQ